MGSAKEPYERLDVRSRWKHEALDFTPWLACNLNLVGEVIGKNLEFKNREIAVCPHLFLDILAKDTDTAKLVAIENQLEWTDIDHLGRLIVYSTLLNARIVIWIATEFTYELAEVLNRLNEWTSNEIEFYGLKIECVRNTADSDPKPRLTKVVYPGGWDKKSTISDTEPDPEIQKYTKFFEPLIDELLSTGFTAKKPIRMFDYTGRFFPSKENDGIWYAASLEGKNDAWITVHIRADDNEMTKDLFNKLKADKNQIESSINKNHPNLEWRWLRHDRHTFSSINVRKDASIDDPADSLEETRAWMLDLLPKFKKVFDPRIAELLSDQQKCDR